MKKVIFSVRLDLESEHDNMKEPLTMYYKCLNWLYFKLLEENKWDALKMLQQELINKKSLFCKYAMNRLTEVMDYEREFDSKRNRRGFNKKIRGFKA